MKKRTKRLLALLSVLLLTATLVTTLAIMPGAQSVTPELDIKYCNLSFNSTIYIKYAVESNVDDVELLVWTEPRVDDYPAGTEEHKITTYYKETINGKVYNIFDFTKLPAKRMADSVYARAHTKVNGLDYYSDVNKYSILQYAYNMKDRDDVAQSLKDLLNGILEYGKLAQKHFEHETDHLVTDSWYEINVNGGTILEDGSNHGLYLKGDTITLTAPAINNDMQQFIAWKDSNGVVISADDRLEIDVWSENETYTPFYSDLLTGGLEFTSNGDGTCYVSGIGTFTGSEIVLPNAYRGEIITGIGEGAFKDNTTITDVFIPDSVKTIGKDAFSGCTALKNLIIGDGVTTVGENAFMNTTALASVVIGDGMTSLDCFDFADNWGYWSSIHPPIKNVVIGEGVKTINDETFIYCYDLERVVIGDKVESIGKKAFNGCTKLRTIIIPDSVKTIGENAFYYCTSLYKLVIGKNVERIEKYAFYNCSSIDNVVIPDSVTYLGDRALSHCTKLNTLTLGKGLKKIEAKPFGDEIKKVYYNGTVADWVSIEFAQSISNPLYNGAALYIGRELVTELTIPSGTTEVKQYAFYGCTSLKKVNVPASVTSFKADAFAGCSDLKNVYYDSDDISDWLSGISFANGAANPLSNGALLELSDSGIKDTLTVGCNINNFALYGCTNSIKLILNDSVESIGNGSFMNSSLVVEFGSKLKSIGDQAFKNNHALLTVTIPDSVKTIGAAAFDGCRGLWYLKLGDGIESVGEGAFINLPALQELYTGNAITTLSIFSTSENNVIKKVVIGNGITEIAEDAFYYCYNLESVTIGENVKIIGPGAFSICEKLEYIELPDSVISIGSKVFLNSGLQSIKLGNGLTSFPDEAFAFCDGFTSFTVPNGITTIDSSVFRDCTNLESIVLPTSLTKIRDYVFFLSGLQKIYYCGTAEQWGAIDLSQCLNPSDLTLTSPRYYYSETQPTESGNFWHYVNGVVTEW